MTNAAIAKELLAEARRLSAKQENLYRVKAYRRAATVVQGLDRSVAEMDERELQVIPGIGRSLAHHIAELSRLVLH